METNKELHNKKSIGVYKTNKNIFEVKDMMNLIDDAEIGRVHNPKQSRIHFFCASLNSEGKQDIKLNHYLSPDDLLTIIDAIENGSFETQYKTNYGSQYVEYKGSAKSDKYNGKPESRVLMIKYNEKMNYPWTISLQIGEGKIEGEGAIKPLNLAKPDSKVEVRFSNHDFKKLMGKTKRYILNWETLAFRKIIDIQYKK